MGDVNRKRLCAVALCAALVSQNAAAAAFELSCNPPGTPVPASSDTKFDYALKLWRGKLKQIRYLEGTDPSKCTSVPDQDGYLGYPVVECTYTSNGGGHSKALTAKVRLLEPSAQQLALWSVHACRANHVIEARMETCLGQLIDEVWLANNATFPVAGIVIERCADSGSGCGADADRPRNVPFQDGVTVNTELKQVGATKDHRWSFVQQPDAMQTSLAAERRANVTKVYKRARVSNFDKNSWANWVAHGSASDALKTMTSDDWLEISRQVQLKACKSDSNELMDAAVFLFAN